MAAPAAISTAAATNVRTSPSPCATSPHSSDPNACDPANTTLNMDSPRARTQPGRNTCSAPVTPISTDSQAMPAGTSSTASTIRSGTNTQASSEPANSTPAPNSSWLAESRAPSRGSTAAPSTAPAPSAPSSRP